MKAIVNIIPFMLIEENHGLQCKQDLPWNIFLIASVNWNGKIKDLLIAYWIIIDDSMSECIPKASKYEGKNSILSTQEK